MPLLGHRGPTAEEIRQAKLDGTYDEKMEFVHGLGHHEMSPELVQKAKNKLKVAQMKLQGKTEAEIEAEERSFALPSGFEGVASTGNPAILTVVIDFADTRISSLYPDISITDINNNIYGDGTTEAQSHAPYESVNAFYKRASENTLSFSGNTLGVYNFSGNQATYTPGMTLVAENQRLFDMVKEALESFDATHDFSQYDNDGDGDIDGLNIIWSGELGGWATFWWGYQWSFFVGDADTTTFDGKTLNTFTWQSLETRSNGSDYNPETLIHEIGHLLGLPDLYDYEPGADLEGGAGGVDIMDSRGNFNAFSRWTLDWITPEIVGSGPAITRELRASGDPSSSLSKAVAIFPNLSNDPFQEFFMIENRYRVGNDGGEANMPSDGLAIWHIDANLNSAQTAFAFNNTDGAHKHVRLIQADGLAEIESGSQADAGDYYNTGDEFTPSSSPASVMYAGSATGIEVKNISADGLVMTADIGFESAVTTPDIADGGSPNHVVSNTSPEHFQSITVDSNLVNGGSDASGGFMVSYYLSADATISAASDIFLGDVPVPSIAGGATVVLNSGALTIPGTVAAGDYYLGWIIDSASEMTESDEGNNLVLYDQGDSVITVVEPTATRDLADTGIGDHAMTPTTVNVGTSNFAVYGKVANTGAGSSGAFDVSLVVSSDSTIDSSDTVLTTKSFPSIAGGGQVDLDFNNVSIPATLAQGDYCVGWLIDSTDVVIETDEGNNVIPFKNGIIKLTVVGPASSIDLEDDGESRHSVSGFAFNVGDPINVSCDIRNSGTTSSGSFDVTFVLSEDNVIDDDDFVIGVVNMSSIDSGDWATCNLSNAPIPATLSTRDYCLGWIIDKADNVTEIGEPADFSNNYVRYRSGGSKISVTNTTPTIELKDAGSAFHTITTPSGTNGVYANELFSFGSSITNTGNTPSGNFIIRAVLYDDLFFEDANAAVIADLPISSILPGQTVPFNFNNVAVPNTGAGGNHYIRWYIDVDTAVVAGTNVEPFATDVDGAIPEEDETNNTVQFLDSTYTLDVLDPSDNVNITDAGVITHSLTGNREIWTIGETLTFSMDITNDGIFSTDPDFPNPRTLEPFQVHFYLSQDTNITTSDILIETTTVAVSNPGVLLNLMPSQFLTDFDTPVGDYYIGWILDAANDITERDETDNVVLFNNGDTIITIKNPGANLDLEDAGDFSQLLSNTNLTVGSSFNLLHSVTNNGSSSVANDFDIHYYLSTDADINFSDFLFHSHTVVDTPDFGNDVMDPGETVAIALNSLSLPTGIPTGSYFIGWIIDPQNYVLEADESNNVVLYRGGLITANVANPSFITDLADSGVDDHSISANVLSAGSTFSISNTVANVGPAPSLPSVVTYYFSLDNTLDASDYVIASSSVTAINQGASVTTGLSNITLPFNIAAGQYHLIWKIDSGNAVLESDENNNTVLYLGGNQLIAVDVLIPDVDLADLGVAHHTVSPQTLNPATNVLNVGGQLVNNGTVNSGPFEVHLYISQDTLTNLPAIPQDHLIGTVMIPDLAGGATAALNFNNLSIPANSADFPLGEYYLGWIIDPVEDTVNEVTETNEANNVVVFNNGFTQVTVTDDVQITGCDRTATGFDISFLTSSTETYTLFTSPDMDPATPWVPIPVNGNTVISGTGGAITVSALDSVFAPVNGKRFFRVDKL